MQEIGIPFPIKGVSDNFDESVQLPLTCRDARNARAIFCGTGRTQGAGRAGTAKFMATPTTFGTGKCAHLTQLTFALSTLDFTEKTQAQAIGAEEWTSPGRPVFNVQTDVQNNAFAIESPNFLVKRNSEGEEINRTTVPLGDDRQELRALVVSETGNVYTAANANKSLTTAAFVDQPVECDQTKGRIWKYAPLRDGLTLAWEFELDGYVPDLCLYDGKLFYLENHKDTFTAYIVVVDNIGDTFTGASQPTPFEIARREVPYPANSLAVNDAGEVYVVSEPFTQRATNPKYPELKRTSEYWTPVDIKPNEAKIHAWWRSDLLIGYLNGDPVHVWADVTGQGRDFTGTYRDMITAANRVGSSPTFAEKSIGDQHGLRFDSTTAAVGTATTGQGLATDRNTTINVQARDQQRTAWPGYGTAAGAENNAQFCMVLICRPNYTAAKQGTLIAQTNDVAAEPLALTANRTEGNAVAAIAVGEIAWNDGSVNYLASGLNNRPLATASLAANSPNVAIVAVINDGNVDTAGANISRTRSRYEVNGLPIDRWHSVIRTSDEPVTLGFFGGAAIATWDKYDGDICEIIVFDRRVPTSPAEAEPRIITHQFTGEAAAGTADDAAHVVHTQANANVLEKVVGYFAHKFGVQHLLPQVAAPFEHPFCVEPPLREGQVAVTNLRDTDSIIAKFGTGALPLIWSATNLGGMGYGLKLEPRADDGTIGILLVGPRVQVGALDSAVLEYRRIQDEGTTVTTSTGAPNFASSGPGPSLENTFGNRHVRMARDESGNWYIPFILPSGTAPTAATTTVLIISSTGALDLRYRTSLVDNDNMGAYAVAIPSSRPAYTVASGTNREEFIWIGTPEESQNGTLTGQDSLRKVRLVTRTQTTRAPRVTQQIGVGGGNLRLFNETAVLGGQPTGSSAIFDTAARNISSAQLFGKLYLTDARNYWFYDPLDGADGSVVKLIAEDGGEIPPGFEFFFEYRGRLGGARQSDRPHAWGMSEIGEPRKWNYIRDVPIVGQAFLGAGSEVGEFPDVINTVVPIGDDYLIFGGDKTIATLAGDPTAGGVFQIVTTAEGMGYGKSWAKDESDNLYFYGSRGTVFYMPVNGRPIPISQHSIDRRLQAINQTLYRVHVEWNSRDETIHFVQIPFANPSTIVDHFVYDTKNQGWWPDRFTAVDHQVTAMCVFDGDEPNDRVLVFGCSDGHVRKWDETSKNDDGVAIDSYVIIGPISQARGEVSFYGLTLELSDTQDGCHVEWYVTDRADVLGPAINNFMAQPGRNYTDNNGGRGSYVWMRLSSAVLNRRWAYRGARVLVHEAGARRKRMA